MQPFRRAALVLFSPSFSALALDDISLNIYTGVYVPTSSRSIF
jgi:hypothetical protein